MELGRLDNLLDYCRRLTGARGAGDPTDGHLLERFAARRDPAAFEGLLERHGPLVLGVCRRVLRDPHDAEDAFQATFLVLVRKAGSLDGRDSVAGWLSTVAFHIALKVKARTARRAAEGRGTEASSVDPAEEAAGRELGPILDEELSRLPDKYRVPLVLCYLQGKTNEEAARLLGWPVGTVSGRLARARDLLRARLVRRGVAPAATATLLVPVPVALVQATTHAAAAPLALGTPLAVLVEGTVRHLARTRIKTAAVLLLVVGAILAAGAVVLPRLWQQPAAQAEPEPGRQEAEASPAVVVRAFYPGANARDIADTVAAPIEQQVNLVEGLTHMASRCDSDGSYTLTITFPAGTDLDRAVTLVRDRVNRAVPDLPDLVKRKEISVKKKPGDVLLFVLLASDGTRDPLFLSDYATTEVKDKLRVAGVGDVVLFGQRDPCLRVRLDPDKLAAANLTAADVVAALQEQNVQTAAGQVGQPPAPTRQGLSLEVKTLGRQPDAKSLEEIILKAGSDGRLMKVKDVAQVEVRPSEESSEARYNGTAVVVLGIAPVPGAKAADVSAAVRARLAQFRGSLPPGVRMEAVFDSSGPTAPGYLRVDVTLPDAASRERTLAVLGRCEQRLAGMKGVGSVLTLAGPPVAPGANRGCLLVGLAPATASKADRERVRAAIRARLTEEARDAVVRLGDPERPGHISSEGYELALAVYGSDGDRRLPRLARMLADRLEKSGKFTDVGLGPGGIDSPQLEVVIDREKAKALGVALNDILQALQGYFGAMYVNDFNRFGRSWQVMVRVGDSSRQSVEDLKRTKVSNSLGELVPLGAVVGVRELSRPTVVQRFNNQPMVTVTANLGPGLSPAAARALCESLSAETLPAGYRLGWLRELPDRGR